MSELPAAGAPKVKRAVVDGRTIDLYGAARAYRVLVIAVAMGFCFPLLSLVIGNAVRSPVNPVVVFFGLQAIVGGTIGWGLYTSGRARERPPAECISVAIIGGVFGVVPIVGLLPAASGSGVIHVLMNKLGLPVGLFGPSAADIAKLRHGVCHQCGYDLAMLAADRCPECNADIAAEKPTADGIMALVQVDAKDAAAQSRRCSLTATAGLVLCPVQWAVFLLLTYNTGWSFVAVFLLPGLVFGFAAGVASLRAQQALQEHGRADFLIAGFAGGCFPPLGSVLLLEQVGRLNAAAARVQDDGAQKGPVPSKPLGDAKGDSAER